jgi:hypothetical protein
MFNDVITSLTGNILNIPIWFFWALMAFLTGFSLNAFYRLFRWIQYARLIENVPTAKIRSAAQGYVELSGIAKLMDGPIIMSPLTGKTCVWYSYIIEEKADTSRTEGHFNSARQIVEQGKSEELFLLEDETGCCVIDPDEWEKARLAAESDVRREQGLKASEEQLNVMMSSGLSDQVYILSSEPEAVLIRQSRWRALKSLRVFFVFGSVAVWLFNVRFGL